MTRRSATKAVLLLSSLAVSGTALPGAQVFEQPDPGRGVIGGEVAMGGWARGKDAELLDPAKYRLHLTPADDLDRELLYPAGTWFQPPKGRYRAWLEGDGRISDTVTLLSYVGGPFRGKGLVFVDEVSPGGTVALDAGSAASESVDLRLVHLESHLRGRFPRLEMARRARGRAAEAGASMPAGLVLPLQFDSAANEYLAVGRPVEVKAGGRTVVSPRPPERGTSDLVVVLERPAPIERHAEADGDLTLAAAGSKLAPEVAIRAATRVIAVWYGVAGRTATLSVTSARVRLEPQEIALRAGRVEGVSLPLRERPDLAVEIELPEGLRGSPAVLAVRTRTERRLLVEEEFQEAPRRHLFAALPPEELEAVLSVPPWRFVERVSLEAGEDATVSFAPEAIELEGTVFVGDEGAPAEIAFKIDGTEEMLRVGTDDDGSYETVLFRSVSAITITSRRRQAPAFLDFLAEPIATSGRRDFFLPDNRFEVRVASSRTGEPIEGAQVHIQNTGSSGFGYSVTAITEEDGVATLPPLRTGLLSFSASAEGFAPMDEPSVEEIGEDDPGDRLELLLSPEGERRAIHFVLPSGRPAAGAAVCVHRALTDAAPRWCGGTDRSGAADVPTSALPGLLLARHDDAGFVVRDLDEIPAGGLRIGLASPAAAPLALQAVDGFGAPVPWADVALFVDGRRLSGAALGWLTENPSATNRRGFWSGRNLPAQKVSVLVWHAEARERARSGALDHLRREIPYPWRETTRLFAER